MLLSCCSLLDVWVVQLNLRSLLHGCFVRRPSVCWRLPKVTPRAGSASSSTTRTTKACSSVMDCCVVVLLLLYCVMVSWVGLLLFVSGAVCVVCCWMCLDVAADVCSRTELPSIAPCRRNPIHRISNTHYLEVSSQPTGYLDISEISRYLPLDIRDGSGLKKARLVFGLVFAGEGFGGSNWVSERANVLTC